MTTNINNIDMIKIMEKALPLQKRQWISNKNIHKMNVDVGISGEKSNRTRQGWDKAGKDMSEKYGKLLITHSYIV